jgi:peptidoglycan/LPS O-acetylase OafA/YrhL
VRGEYRPELDGLRGLAIALVLTSHILLEERGSFALVGVSVFFTLSGYLITGILWRERRATGRLDLRRFYARRVRRLGPALIVLVAFVAATGVADVWGRQQWATSALALVTYTTNWLVPLGQVAFPFGHVWTLAIEEQFYLLWPLVLAIVPARGMVVVFITALVIGTASRSLPGQLSYFATTSYVDVIGLGCAAAIWDRRLGPRVDVLALPTIAIAVVVGSPLLAAIGTMTMCQSRSQVLTPLAAIGRRAYSLYLWDWPMTMLYGSIGVVPAMACAELSYRYVERRFLSSRFSRVIAEEPAPRGTGQ